MQSKNQVIVVIRTDITAEYEDDFNRWYDEEHIPNLLSVPGVISAKRGVNAGKGQKYIAVYVHENINIQHSSEYKAAVETPWTLKLSSYFIGMTREVYQVL